MGLLPVAVRGTLSHAWSPGPWLSLFQPAGFSFGFLTASLVLNLNQTLPIACFVGVLMPTFPQQFPFSPLRTKSPLCIFSPWWGPALNGLIIWTWKSLPWTFCGKVSLNRLNPWLSMLQGPSLSGHLAPHTLAACMNQGNDHSLQQQPPGPKG